MVIPTDRPIADPHTNAELQGSLLRDHEHKFAATPVWRLLNKDNFFITLDEEWPDDMKNLCREYTLLRIEEASRVRAWILANTKVGRSWMWRSACIKKRSVSKSWSNPFIETEQFLGFELWTEITNTLRNVRNHLLCKRWAQSYRETCCEGKAANKAYRDTVSHFYSCSWKKLDRHQPKEIPWRLFCSVKTHDQITATWSINSSRRWWSSTVWQHNGRIQGKIRWFFAMPMNDWITCLVKGEDQRKGFNVAWTLTLPNTSCISEQHRDFQEVISLILLCKTMYCCQRTSPSTSITSEV